MRSDFRRSLFAAEIFQFGSTVVQDCDESIPGTSKQEDSTVAGADIVWTPLTNKTLDTVSTIHDLI